MITKFATLIALSVGLLLTVGDEPIATPTCCIKKAYCCSIKRECCKGPRLESTVVTTGNQVAGAEIAKPSCCWKRAYCCTIKGACCGRSANMDATISTALTSDAVAKSTCCIKRAYCCSVQARCCPNTASAGIAAQRQQRLWTWMFKSPHKEKSPLAATMLTGVCRISSQRV